MRRYVSVLWILVTSLAACAATPAQDQPAQALSGFFQNDTVRIDLRLADRAGHVSNVISGLADLEGSRPRS